ncbi:MAG: NAD-dependent epimerase/dehydratase family protein [Candidatus Omnitrophica bacterium]|nr:NAD-dependent epimerase/dehydratase family protein [Candidatus Omnitrophota bacterium]
METVFLIGGRSFIGGHVCRVLIQRGYNVLLHSTSTPKFENLKDILPHPQVTTVVCPYENTQLLSELMAKAKFLIFSAVPPGKQTLGQKQAKGRDFSNLNNILEVLSAHPIEKSVFISTCGTIGSIDIGSADENCIAKKGQGWAGLAFKFEIEKLVMDYYKKGLKIVIVNPTMFIGEHDTKPSTGEFFRFLDKFPFIILKGEKINIIDVADAALGTVLALEKGRVGERYILGGRNILHEELIARIKKCGGKKMPKFAIPLSLSILTAVTSELINLILKQDKPMVPLIGIELQTHGSQHYSTAKAERELGYVPGDAWAAVDRAYAWYKDHGMLSK